MKKNEFDGLELPNEGQTAAHPSGDCKTAGETGTPASVGNESEPAPLSSDVLVSEKDAINDLWDKLVKVANVEPLLNKFYKRLNEMIHATNDIRKVISNTMARYLVTDQQVLRFEASFVKHFDDALQQKMQKEFQKFTFDLEHARNEAVNNFTAEIKGGWWFSSKVGWFLYMSNIITIAIAALVCYFK